MCIRLEDMCVLLMLLLLSYQDIRRRRISCNIMMAGFMFIVIYILAQRKGMIALHLAGLSVGAVFCIISYATKECIGYGDSILIGLLGLYKGIWELLELMVISWLLLALAAFMVLIIKKYSKKAALPYVPFLTIGYICTLLFWEGTI